MTVLEKPVQERVAAGLRRMQKKPDALLFLDDIEDWTWDEFRCCGLPVFHSSSPWAEIPFCPIWDDEYTDAAADVARFMEGYRGE